MLYDLVFEGGGAKGSVFAGAMENTIIRELVDTKDQLFPGGWEVITDDPKNSSPKWQSNIVNLLIGWPNSSSKLTRK